VRGELSGGHAEELGSVGPGHLRPVYADELPDVTKPGRREQGVDDGVARDIPVGVARKAGLARKVDPRKDERDPVCETVGVDAEAYGDFLIEVFDAWSASDVGEVHVMNFEWALAAWCQLPASTCIFASRCGKSAIVEHESVFDIFDSHSTSIGYFETLYDLDSGSFKPQVAKAAYGDDYQWNPNLLILDRLIVYPKYRGHGVGLLALRALIHRLRVGVGLIAMKPYPLQYEAKFLCESNADERKRMELANFQLPQPKATAKLRKYYGRLGFKMVPRTEYMVRSVELPLPSPTSL